MKVAITHFKSHCAQIIETLQTTGEAVIITKRDKAIAQMLPIDIKKDTKKETLFGLLKNKADIKDDIVDPIDEKWNAEYE